MEAKVRRATSIWHMADWDKFDIHKFHIRNPGGVVHCRSCHCGHVNDVNLGGRCFDTPVHLMAEADFRLWQALLK